MNRTKLIAALGLGLTGLACANGADDGVTTPDGLPALTAEEQAVVDNMKANTLAEISLPEGTMKFIEYAPGEVSIDRQFAIGAKLTRVPGEDEMTLDQLFRAYAPGRDVPSSLLAAMARVEKLERDRATFSIGETTRLATPKESSAPAEQFAGAPLEGAVAPSSSDTESVKSALASSVDQTWFVNTFCRVGGADWTWCYAVAWQNAYVSWKTHRSNSVTCGDTGAARVQMHVGGTLKKNFDVPYGQCWYSGAYHHSHGAFGINTEITQKYSIPYAAQTVRFAGWMANEDQFISGY
jgi:hypothetical protein